LGYFANLYVVEASANPTGVELTTSIFGAPIGERAYFSWGPGERPIGLKQYAQGTLFCDAALKLLRGYPRRERHGEREGEDPDRCLIEAAFAPRNADDPVLFHFVLPDRFIPRRDLEPLVQPRPPFVFRSGERIVATYPVAGSGEIRFWISRLRPREALTDYDLTKVLHPYEQRAVKAEFEFNLGFFKIKVA